MLSFYPEMQHSITIAAEAPPAFTLGTTFFNYFFLTHVSNLLPLPKSHSSRSHRSTELTLFIHFQLLLVKATC